VAHAATPSPTAKPTPAIHRGFIEGPFDHVCGIIHDDASFAPSRIPAWVRAECSTRVYFIIHHGPPSSQGLPGSVHGR